jgi:dynein heavy chain 2
LQERRRFIPQGWTKFYEFSDADLAAASSIIERSTASSSSPCWAFILALLDHAIYGSRLDSCTDGRMLRTFIRTFFDKKILQGAAPIPGTATPLPAFGSASTVPHEIQRLTSSLPEVDTPALLCLAANVARAEQEASGSRVVADLRRLSIQQLNSAGADSGAVQRQLQPLLAAWHALQKEHPSLCNAQTAHRTSSLCHRVRFSRVHA